MHAKTLYRAVVVQELPKEGRFYSEEAASYVNLGYLYQYESFLGLGFKAAGGQFCLLYEARDDLYAPLSGKDLLAFLTKYDLPTPPKASYVLWRDRFALPAALSVWVLSVAAALLFKLKKRKTQPRSRGYLRRR